MNRNANHDFSPHSVESEVAVLGSIFMAPDMINAVRAIPLTGDDFFTVKHGWIFDAACKVYDQAGTIDTRIVAEELKVRQHLDDVGGEGYLNYLPGEVPTALHAEVYGHIVKRAAIRRQLVDAAGEIVRLANNEELDVQDVIDAAQSSVFDIHRPDGGDVTPFEIALSETYDEIEALRSGVSKSITIDTPWPDLNRIIGGFRDGQLIIPAARPGLGKSAFMTQIATHAAKAGLNVLFCSLEMSEREIVSRIIAQEIGISTQEQDGMTDRQWKHFVDWAGGNAVDLRTITFDTSSAVTPMQLSSRARDFKRRGQLDLLIVDYIQLMTGNRNRSNRVNEMGDITRALKLLPMELKVPVMAASQLNRDNARAGQAPQLHNMRDSGSLEQDADTVIFIHNPNENGEADTQAKEPNGKREFIVAKGRSTGTSLSYGNVPVTWLGKQIKFVPMARTSQEAPEWMQ